MLAKINILIIILLFNSCTSLKDTFYPPSKEDLLALKNKEQSDYSPNEEWFVRYLNAKNYQLKGQSQKACSSFQKLSSSRKFPLKDLALIKSIEVCNFKEEKLIEIFESTSRIENSFLAKYYFETSMNFSKKLSNKYYYAYFLYKSSYYLKNSKEKELYLRTALNLATEDNDKEEIEKALIVAAPRFSKEVNFDNAYKVARDYEKNRQFKKARKTYFFIINNPEYELKDRYKSFERVCITYKNSRDKKSYIEKRKQMINFLKSVSGDSEEKNEYYTKAFLDYIRALWTDNDTDRSIVLSRKLLKNFNGNEEQKSTLLWILGNMYKEKEKHITALRYFNEALKISKIDHEYYDDIVWDVGWSHYIQKNYVASAKVFKKSYEEGDAFNSNRSRYKYWFAKSLQKIGENLIAKLKLDEIIEEDPFSYYSLLAHIENSKSFNPFSAPKREEKRLSPEFEWLTTLSEFKAASDYLDYVLKNDPSSGGIYSRLGHYTKAQYYDGGILAFYRLSKEERKKTENLYGDIIYPRAYEQEILESANKYKVPSELIFSIIRQESAFNKYARSPSDAFGLMQLIPNLARKLSANSDARYSNYNDLYDEKINVSLGTQHISHLLEKNKSSLIKTIAIYNAGSRPVNLWYQKRFRKDPFEFIERIPYKETRNYVKLVLRNIMIYKQILAKKPFYFSKNSIF